MKKFSKYGMLLAAALCVGMGSCSDDDDNEGLAGGFASNNPLVIEGKMLALYMEKAEESCHAMAHSIVSMLKSGMDKNDIAEAVKARYYHGYIKTVYPIDAMNLNTGIMIDMIERECLHQ